MLYVLNEETTNSGLPMTRAQTFSGVLGNYIQINSISDSSSPSGTIQYNYTIIAQVPSGVYIKLGYEYPAVTQTTGEMTTTATTTGTWIKTVTKKGLYSNYQSRLQLTSYSYSEMEILSNKFAYPSSQTFYHEVTKLEEVDDKSLSTALILGSLLYGGPSAK